MALVEGGGVDSQFDSGELNADPCNFKLALPRWKFGIRLPTIHLPLPIPIPIPKLNFELSCDPTHPISMSAGVEWGGGNTPVYQKSPDLEEII